MIKLFTDKEFNNAKSIDLLPCKCYCCGETFHKSKHTIQRAMNPNHSIKNMYCSKLCQSKSQITKVSVICNNCKVSFEKKPTDINRTNNNFCSKSCATTYRNGHKTTGTRISKLELWIQSQLDDLYPNIEILYNRKDTINSELDIYIPSLKLAFELNGIFHYEPIYGESKLNQIQNNDNRKFQACLEQGIELCIIDTSQQKYFKEKSSLKYLNIILTIINQRTISNS